ncbi:hypothetical protein JG688_00014557 [Phytophthora aleatoria]|uniref:Uncharacterized protein n=1 Tax=Phytophthora aleatoria TaxID=2496075 RepID=A0A8J5M0E1_9STRA|nr:hypothetical protein JG688_00014557 [Phytophthora aleatoria]
MTGHTKGLATRISKAIADQKVIRVWYGLPQHDLVMNNCFETTLGENYMPFKHLQQNQANCSLRYKDGQHYCPNNVQCYASGSKPTNG